MRLCRTDATPGAPDATPDATPGATLAPFCRTTVCGHVRARVGAAAGFKPEVCKQRYTKFMVSEKSYIRR